MDSGPFPPPFLQLSVLAVCFSKWEGGAGWETMVERQVQSWPTSSQWTLPSLPWPSLAHPRVFSACCLQLELQKEFFLSSLFCHISPISMKGFWFCPLAEAVSELGSTHLQAPFPNYLKPPGCIATPLSLPGCIRENGQNCLFWWSQSWTGVN